MAAPFNEGKALAALAYVASERPGLTPFFVSKVFYLAEKEHVNNTDARSLRTPASRCPRARFLRPSRITSMRIGIG